jgi:hypothetical protein
MPTIRSRGQERDPAGDDRRAARDRRRTPPDPIEHDS